MAENEEKIEYTPEELEEIERISNLITQDMADLKKAKTDPEVTEKKSKEPDLMTNTPTDLADLGGEDLGVAPGDLPELEVEDLGESPDDLAPLKEEEIAAETSENGIENLKDLEDVELSFPESPSEEMKEEEIDEVEGLEDISELIHEVEEPIEDEDLLELDSEDLTAISEDDAPTLEEEVGMSPLEELDDITTSEDEFDIAQSALGEQAGSEGGITEKGIEQIGEESGQEDIIDVTTEKESDQEIPNLSEISLEEKTDISEVEDIKDINFDELGDFSLTDSVVDDKDSDVNTGIDPKIEEGEGGAKEEEIAEVSDTKDANGIDDIGEIMPIEDEEAVSPPLEKEKGEDVKIELSDDELVKLKKALQLFHPNLRNIVSEVILKDTLSARDTKKLVDKILNEESEDDIKGFLEKKLRKKIDIEEEIKGSKRRVIASRPEYTREGIERQKRILLLTKVIALAAFITFFVTILSYQFIYKPVMARKYINSGVALIKEAGDPVTKKGKDYKKAEDLFKDVDENYIKDYPYGYNSYAMAYFEKKEYDLAYKKLNEIYKIVPRNIDALNNFGHFYTKISEDYYIKKHTPEGQINTQLDVAISFYRKALSNDPENIIAMLGIGNAYMYLGQFQKARKYYENILSVDRNSSKGYAGLLNFFIERDDLAEVLSVHSSIQVRDLEEEMPSALLAKLATYYLSKKRTDSNNIRIDFGIQSQLVKDFNDNPYPVVQKVLKSLHVRDSHYPPLYLCYAKLDRELKQLTLMEKNLNYALKEEPNYFGALHLYGEYHYYLKEPAEAYKYFKKAIKASLSPPEFTFDDFYYETESIGKTNAMIGNIFYNFFDKIKYRFGDELEEAEFDNELEIMGNYEIAKKNYLKALDQGYKSSEIFYNLGRIHYMKGQYKQSIKTWLNLYDDFNTRPELMFALGNAFFHLQNMEMSKGEYLKMISVYEHKLDKINKIIPESQEHVNIYQSLASAYNNLGSVYLLQKKETKSNISFWKAIDFAKRIDRENEYARVNLARAFKSRRKEIPPILDENIPFSIDSYREGNIETGL